MIPPSIRLRRAIHLRSLALVRRIVLSNPECPNLIRNADPTDQNFTSLHLAAKFGLVDIASFLLDHGHEDPGISRDFSDVTPLMLAAQAGSDDSDETTRARMEVGRLIATHCPESIVVKDKQGLDAFSHACRHGSLILVQTLIALPHPSSPFVSDETKAPTSPSPPPPTALPSQPKPQALSWPLPAASPATSPAPAPNPPPTSDYPQLQVRDNLGNTPLHHASAAGQLKTLRLLLSLGADHLARNYAQWTPIDYSATVAAEVYLRGLVREREGARVLGNISASEGTGPRSDQSSGQPDAHMHNRGAMRLVQSEDEGSEIGSDEIEVLRGRARTAT